MERALLKIKRKRDIDGITFEEGAEFPRAFYARVRQAAGSVAKSQKRAADLDHTGIEEQLDVVESTDTINKWKVAFFERHKIVIPYAQTPGCQVLSRLRKEISYRNISVWDMEKVKGLSFEKRQGKTTKEVVDGIQITMDAKLTEEERPETVQDYLNALEMYLLALSIAGITPLSSAPKEGGS